MSSLFLVELEVALKLWNKNNTHDCCVEFLGTVLGQIQFLNVQWIAVKVVEICSFCLPH